MDNVNQSNTIRICVPILSKQIVLSPILGAKKLCIGTYDILTQESCPCPGKALIGLSNKSNCDNCYKKTGFNPAFCGKGPNYISKKQEQYNAMPHYVYLAHFGQNTIKVGTAYHKRLIGRLTEQGARAALIVKKCKNAYEAYTLEQDICKRSGITDRIYTSRKITLLRSKFDSESAQKELLACNDLKDHNDLLDLNTYYFLTKEHAIPNNFTEMTTLGSEIECKIKAMVGKALILEYNGNYKLISVDKLMGKTNVIIK